MILRVLLNSNPEQVEYAFALLTDEGVLQQRGVSEVAGLPLADSVILVIPASALMLTTVKLPSSVRYQSAKFEQLLPAAVEDSVLTDIGQIHIVAGPAIEEGLYPVAVVDADWLRPQVEAFKRTDRPLTMIVPEPLFGEVAPNVWRLQLRGNDGILRTAPMQAILTDRPEGTPPVTLSLLLKQTEQKPEKIEIISEDGQPIDENEWASDLDTPVETLHFPTSAPVWANGEMPKLNMATGEFAQLRRKKAISWKRFKLPLFLLCSLLVLVLIDIGITLAKDLYTRRQLRNEIQDTFAAAFPDIANETDPAGRMTREIVKLQHKVGELTPSDFQPMLVATANALANSNIMQIQGLEFEGGSLTCQLGAVPEPTMNEVVEALAQEGYSAHADFSNTSVTLQVSR